MPTFGWSEGLNNKIHIQCLAQCLALDKHSVNAGVTVTIPTPVQPGRAHPQSPGEAPPLHLIPEKD